MGKLGLPALTGMVAVSLSACATGGTPDAQEMVAHKAPTYWAQTEPNYTKESNATSASLWTTAPNALLGMRRAKDVGDLLTVVVDMNDQASMQSSLSRNRQTNEQFNILSKDGYNNINHSLAIVKKMYPSQLNWQCAKGSAMLALHCFYVSHVAPRAY